MQTRLYRHVHLWLLSHRTLAQEFPVLNPYAPNITLIAMSTILILSAFLTIEINENDKLEFNNT